MSHPREILISINAPLVEKLLSGQKTIEFRRRPIGVSRGSSVWIYSKVPEGSVRALGIVQQSHHGTVEDIWQKFSSKSGISKEFYLNYFSGLDSAFAIEFKSVTKLNNPVGLSEIRKAVPNFSPPQFFHYLDPDNKVLRLFNMMNTQPVSSLDKHAFA